MQNREEGDLVQNIILDDREHALYEKCMLIQTGSSPFPNIKIKKETLPLGDVSVFNTWLIERKSLADLLASIKDGRYEEQSYRLQHAFDPRRVIYVIEGVLSTLKTSRERKLVHTTMTSLQVFKGFAVVRTASVQETAEWLLAMADKIDRDIKTKGRIPFYKIRTDAAQEPSTDTAAAAYCSVVKKVKKENVTPQNMCEIVLCQLPGISHVAATAISQVYPSLIQLMDALRLDSECLHSLMTTDKNGKKRKLGQNVHNAIAEYLMFVHSPCANRVEETTFTLPMQETDSPHCLIKVETQEV